MPPDWRVASASEEMLATLDTLAAVAGLATALGTALLAAATFVLARRTGEQSRTATAALEAQVRPLLIDVAPGSDGDHEAPLYPNGERGEKWKRGYAVVTFDGGRGYVSVPLRNIGPGPAHILGARLEATHASGPPLELWMATKQFVPSGEVVRVSLLLGNDARHLQGAFVDAVRQRGSGLTLVVEYADVGGGQRTRSRLELARRIAEEGWIVAGIEHYRCGDGGDGPDPRVEPGHWGRRALRRPREAAGMANSEL
jgi:hypothetical protein